MAASSALFIVCRFGYDVDVSGDECVWVGHSRT